MSLSPQETAKQIQADFVNQAEGARASVLGFFNEGRQVGGTSFKTKNESVEVTEIARQPVLEICPVHGPFLALMISITKADVSPKLAIDIFVNFSEQAQANQEQQEDNSASPTQ